MRKYRRQYILVQVHEEDESTTTPLTGKLIAHSPSRDTVYKKWDAVKDWSRPILFCYTGPIPRGTEFIMSI